MTSALIIETTTPAASIALIRDGRLREERSFTSDRRHNSLLFSPLQELITLNGNQKLDLILVGSGPGSYSGTRVGIAAAQGAALVAGCKAIAIPSILATKEAISGKKCLAIGDARRGSYWLAHIVEGQLISGPELTDQAGLDSAISTAQSAGHACFGMAEIPGKDIPISLPNPTGLWNAWQTAPPETKSLWMEEIPQPIYLKPPHITRSKKPSPRGKAV